MRLEGGKGVWRWGKREIIYLSLHCHHQNDSCIKMGSDESHFSVSVGSDGQSHKTVSTSHNLSEERGEPMRYQTEVLPLTSLTNALPLGQTGSRTQDKAYISLFIYTLCSLMDSLRRTYVLTFLQSRHHHQTMISVVHRMQAAN